MLTLFEHAWGMPCFVYDCSPDLRIPVSAVDNSANSTSCNWQLDHEKRLSKTFLSCHYLHLTESLQHKPFYIQATLRFPIHQLRCWYSILLRLWLNFPYPSCPVKTIYLQIWWFWIRIFLRVPLLAEKFLLLLKLNILSKTLLVGLVNALPQSWKQAVVSELMKSWLVRDTWFSQDRNATKIWWAYRIEALR